MHPNQRPLTILPQHDVPQLQLPLDRIPNPCPLQRIHTELEQVDRLGQLGGLDRPERLGYARKDLLLELWAG